MNQALIIIDIQNDYFPSGKMELSGIDKAAGNVVHALELFRDRNLPVFHIQHIAKKEGATFFLPNTKGADIHESVAPKSGEPVLQKHFPSSFQKTGLHRQLQNLGINDLVICGAMTHMCIDTTVRAAFDLGYNSTLLIDGCATRDLEFEGEIVMAAQVQAAYMAALSSVFAKAISTGQLKELL